MGEFSENPNKDSLIFFQWSKLKLFLELNHLNALSLKDCVVGFIFETKTWYPSSKRS